MSGDDHSSVLGGSYTSEVDTLRTSLFPGSSHQNHPSDLSGVLVDPTTPYLKILFTAFLGAELKCF